jgi:peptidoglycan/xylan/chitin deacetylase (PgdA/CDA1 family)
MQFWALGLLLGLAVTILILEWISAPIEWLWPHQLKGNTHWRGQISGNCISLTFDDGPSRYTEQILDILKAHGVVATFFVIGAQVVRYPELIERMADEGHEIGNHMYSFDAKTGLHLLYHPVPNGEIARTQDAIKDITGTSPRFFRSPAGQMGRGLWRQIKVHDLEVVYGAMPTPDVHANAESQLITALETAKPGAILILHDGDDHDPDSDRPRPTVDMLPRLLMQLRANGFQIVPLRKLLYRPGC